LIQFRSEPAALAELASLASARGWTDLAYLLYQNSLQSNLSGFPFVVYYVGSLVKSGDAAGAEAVWHELAIRNSAQLVAVSYMGAMVAQGAGHDSEASQIVEQIRKETETDLPRRRIIINLFRSYGFAQMANQLDGQPS
jgi:hypothetical protein